MDPDVTLEELRKALEDFRKTYETNSLAMQVSPLGSSASRVADGFEAIDTWLSNGGFLPADWSKHRG